MSHSERKPKIVDDSQGEAKSEKIEIIVVFEGQRTTLKLKPTTKFEKIFTAIENKFGAQAGTFRFRVEDRRIQKDDTPADLDIEDGDQIDAYLEQVGGTLHQRFPFSHPRW